MEQKEFRRGDFEVSNGVLTNVIRRGLENRGVFEQEGFNGRVALFDGNELYVIKNCEQIIVTRLWYNQY